MVMDSLIVWFSEEFGWKSFLVVIIVSVSLSVYLHKSNLPPGPIGLPYVGYYPFFKKDIHKHLRQLAEKYGEVFSFTVMGQLYIHLNTLSAIKEAHITKADIFCMRSETFSLFRYIDNGRGLVFCNGQEWKDVRSFVIQALKQYGLGKRSLENHIHDSVRTTLDVLKNTASKPCDVLRDLSRGITSVITQLLFGGNLEQYEEEVQNLHDSLMRMFGEFGTHQFLVGPVYQHVVLPLLPGYKTLKALKTEINSVMGKIVDDHIETFDKDNLRDFIDVYLNERRMLQEQGNQKANFFPVDRLKSTLIHLFIDGTETAAAAIYHLLRAMIDHPEIQERIQKELDEVVGKERLPSLEDKGNLPYTEATLLEYLRTSVIFPYSQSLENVRETTLGGYRIPSGSITVINMWSAHQDPLIYKNPEKFNPDRFLDTDGRRIKTQMPVSFGVGKRSCLGESLANMELFLFLAGILQNFTLFPPEDTTPKAASFEEVLQYEMRAIPRNTN